MRTNVAFEKHHKLIAAVVVLVLTVVMISCCLLPLRVDGDIAICDEPTVLKYACCDINGQCISDCARTRDEAINGPRLQCHYCRNVTRAEAECGLCHVRHYVANGGTGNPRLFSDADECLRRTHDKVWTVAPNAVGVFRVRLDDADARLTAIMITDSGGFEVAGLTRHYREAVNALPLRYGPARGVAFLLQNEYDRDRQPCNWFKQDSPRVGDRAQHCIDTHDPVEMMSFAEASPTGYYYVFVHASHTGWSGSIVPILTWSGPLSDSWFATNVVMFFGSVATSLVALIVCACANHRLLRQPKHRDRREGLCIVICVLAAFFAFSPMLWAQFFFFENLTILW